MSDDEDTTPLNSVKYYRPKASLKNASIETALRTTLVPTIVSRCSVVAIRSIFDFATQEETVKQLAARRKLIEDAVLKLDMVSAYAFFL